MFMALSSLNNGLCALALVSACSGDVSLVQHSDRNIKPETHQLAAPVVENKVVLVASVEPMEPTKKLISCAKEVKIVLASPEARSPNLSRGKCTQKDVVTVDFVIPETTGPRLLVSSDHAFKLGNQDITPEKNLCDIGDVGRIPCGSVNLDNIRANPKIELAPSQAHQEFWFSTLRTAGSGF
jgi:hypothetical protein